jgi:hypothetical protein
MTPTSGLHRGVTLRIDGHLLASWRSHASGEGRSET